MITVKNEITVFEINGKEAPIGAPSLIIENVWNRRKCVRLKFGEVSVVVLDRELLKAIGNATDNES